MENHNNPGLTAVVSLFCAVCGFDMVMTFFYITPAEGVVELLISLLLIYGVVLVALGLSVFVISFIKLYERRYYD